MKKEDMNETIVLEEEEIVVEEKKPTKKNSQTSAEEKSKGSGKPKTGKAANSRYVQVRKGASGSSQVVTTMNLGEEAEILERMTGFYKVRTKKGGYVGFVASNYFKED